MMRDARFVFAPIYWPYEIRRRDKRLGAVFAILAIVPVYLGMLSGCASSAPTDRQVYTSVDDAKVAVETVLRLFNVKYQEAMKSPDLVVRTKWSEHRKKANDAYDKFNRAKSLAITAGRDLGQDANALKIISDAADDAILLLKSFTEGS